MEFKEIIDLGTELISVPVLVWLAAKVQLNSKLIGNHLMHAVQRLEKSVDGLPCRKDCAEK